MDIKPIFNISGGIYNEPQIVKINVESADNQIYYRLNNEPMYHLYMGPIAITSTNTIKSVCLIDGVLSEEVEVNIEIKPLDQPKQGHLVVVGGAEHCQELHKRIVELSGGAEQAKVVIIPTSSADAYAAGMDRFTRFTELAGVRVDTSKVPERNGKRDYSDINNTSNFWIMPIAVKDDENTNANPTDDPDAVLSDESRFPDIDESKWIYNAYHAEIAQKFLDNKYNIIFLTGGNQSRYLKCLLHPDGTDSPVMAILRYLYLNHGAVVIGTSAGGTVMSKHAIFGGSSFCSLKYGSIYQEINLLEYNDDTVPYKENDARVWLGSGLNLLPRGFISDTHFVERGRLGRLSEACMNYKERKHKSPIGIGADEDTAIIISPNNIIEISGATGAFITDYSKASVDIINGNRILRNVKLNYAEDGDKFHYDEASGQVILVEIGKTKKIMESRGSSNDEVLLEGDIFGRSSILNLINQGFIKGNFNTIMGLQLSDNQYDSYDKMMVDKVEKEGTVAMLIHKTEETKIYSGSISFNWWGAGDYDYPRLKTEYDANRFSVVNLLVDFIPSSVHNYPDLGLAKSVIPKCLHIADGYSESEWNKMFDNAKEYKFGLSVIPFGEKMLLQTFFLDYAYFDRDNNGYYSPLKYDIILDEEHDHEDYDILQLPICGGTKILFNGQLVGICDDNGQLFLEQPLKLETFSIEAIYEGKSTYKVSCEYMPHSQCGITVFNVENKMEDSVLQ